MNAHSALTVPDRLARNGSAFTGGFIVRKPCGAFSFCPISGSGNHRLVELRIARQGIVLGTQLGWIRTGMGNLFRSAVSFNHTDNPNKIVGVVRFNEHDGYSVVLVEQQIGEPSARALPINDLMRTMGYALSGIVKCRRVTL